MSPHCRSMLRLGLVLGNRHGHRNLMSRAAMKCMFELVGVAHHLKFNLSSALRVPYIHYDTVKLIKARQRCNIGDKISDKDAATAWAMARLVWQNMMGTIFNYFTISKAAYESRYDRIKAIRINGILHEFSWM